MLQSNELKHEYFMRKALAEASKSLKSGDVPVGAIVVYNGKIIGKGYNRVEKQKNSTKHAEIVAINSAIKNYGHKHLLECEMYITLEPCSMCAGAIILSRIKKVYFGASDYKTGAAGSIFNILNEPKLNHRCEVFGNILYDECSGMIKDFFKELRNKK